MYQLTGDQQLAVGVLCPAVAGRESRTTLPLCPLKVCLSWRQFSLAEEITDQ